MIATLLAAAAAVALPPPMVQDCEPFRDVPVNMITLFDEPRYDHSLSLDEIQNLARDSEHSIHEGIVLGLTHYQPFVQFSTPLTVITSPDGTSCAEVQKADVTFGYQDVVVYIGSEIPEGTCGYDEVMAHEQKHIAVNRKILDKYVPIIRQRLAEYLKNNGMFREGNTDYAVSLIKDGLHKILDDLGNEIFRENQQLQQDVDSLEEYRRISASCNGQLYNIAMKERGGIR